MFLGTGNAGEVRLNDEAHRYLAQRSIDCKAMPTLEVIEAYNRSKQAQSGLDPCHQRLTGGRWSVMDTRTRFRFCCPPDP